MTPITPWVLCALGTLMLAATTLLAALVGTDTEQQISQVRTLSTVGTAMQAAAITAVWFWDAHHWVVWPATVIGTVSVVYTWTMRGLARQIAGRPRWDRGMVSAAPAPVIDVDGNPVTSPLQRSPWRDR